MVDPIKPYLSQALCNLDSPWDNGSNSTGSLDTLSTSADLTASGLLASGTNPLNSDPFTYGTTSTDPTSSTVLNQNTPTP